MPEEIYVLGIVIDGRDSTAPEVQKVLTRYGSRILGRKGIPEPGSLGAPRCIPPCKMITAA